MKPEERLIASKKSWIIGNGTVEAALTMKGAHLAPVRFRLGAGKPIEPYYISPWQDENLRIDEPVLEMLRGDFFCMPFGAAGSSGGEAHVTHGEPATAEWSLERYEQHASFSELSLSLTTRVRAGRVTKKVFLVEGHDVVYTQDLMEGYTGRMPAGHHATLAVPERPGSFLVATSPILFGMTDPGTPRFHQDGEYFALPAGRRFTTLREVPTVWAEEPVMDCSTFPRREGFTDIISVFADPAYSKNGTPAWTTAVNTEKNYLWFSLKDPSVLPSTVLWMANRGRHRAPWSGRNHCLGLEDVRACFASGLAASTAPNELSRQGIPTAFELSPTVPTAVNYIQGAVAVPGGFDRVASAAFRDGAVEFTSISGKKVEIAVNHAFLRTGNPASS